MTGDVVAIRQPHEPLDPIDVPELIVRHQLMQTFGMKWSRIYPGEKANPCVDLRVEKFNTSASCRLPPNTARSPMSWTRGVPRMKKSCIKSALGR
jgi:hypothetical protein